jgi:isopenicillin N synthase-like dioxygenase
MPSLVEIPLITPNQPNSLAALEVIDLFLLVKEDKSEIARLLLACQTHGFFHLDLRNGVGKDAVNGFEDLLAIMKAWFNQPVEEKIKYDIGSDKHG